MRRTYKPEVPRAGDSDFSWWAEKLPYPQTIIAVEETTEPRFSGLYDAAGNRLMVCVERDPAGFVRHRK